MMDRFGELAKLNEQMARKIHEGALVMRELRIRQERIQDHIAASDKMIELYRETRTARAV